MHTALPIGSPAVPGPADRQRILLVDDDAVSRRVVRHALAPLDVQITELDRADDIVAVARAVQPDLVLLDLMMPGVDGHTACRQLRADPDLRDVPVVMITAYAEHESMLAAFDAGVDDFLARPVRRVELQARTRSILRVGRYRRALEHRQAPRELLAQLPVATLIVDGAGTIVARNPAACELLGAAVSLEDRLAEPSRAALRAALHAASGRGGLSHCDLVLADEPVRTLALSVGRLRWDGAPSLVAFAADVSALRGVEQTWLRCEREHQRNVISAGLVHDLASRLQAARLQQRLLARTTAATHDSQATELHEDLGRALLGASALLEELRALAQDRFASSSTAACAVEEVTARALRRGAYLLPPGLRITSAGVPTGTVAIADRVLEDILLNLVTNARDAIADRGGTIHLSGVRRSDQIVLSVDDDGPGIPSSLQARLGQPFVTSKPHGQGTGLGLWMIRTQLERVGGAFHIGDGPQGGTRATITLPLA
jgi:two-component system NtrC family sensor kinase